MNGDEPGWVRAAVSVAVHNGQRLLMVREAKPDVHGRWNLPGGRLERNESAFAGAVREVHEETHLNVELDGLLGIWHSPGWFRLVFTASVDDSLAESAHAGDEILEVKWFELSDLQRLTVDDLEHPVVKSILDRVIAGEAESWPLEVLTAAT